MAASGHRIALVALALSACVDGGDDSLYGCGDRPVAAVDGGGVADASADAGGTDAAPVSDIRVTSPNGGEALIGGVGIDITWVAPPGVAAVDVVLVRDDAEVLAIGTGVPAGDALPWTPPIDLATGDAYRVRVTDAASSATDDSDGAFSIVNWQYRREVTATSTEALADFQVLVELESASFDYAHAAADGADVRFATDAARAGGFDLDYFVEAWDPAGTSRIWVKLPVLDGATTVHMFYGAPGVVSESDFDAVFPAQFTSADVELSGTQVFDWFELDAAHTVTVTAGAPLVVRARVVRVDGAIVADARGRAGGSGGAGGGEGSNEAGAGGGGYGGAGGNGARDFSEGLARGGPPQGSATARDIDMGFGGGSTDVFAGGAGGGALSLFGHTIDVAGTLSADGGAGEPAADPMGQVRGGGGGAGGGILIDGHDVTLSGTLSARGGDGGLAAPGTNHDGGGGGGGGRIKVFHGGGLADSSALEVGGGSGGGGGDNDTAQDGGTGSVHVTDVAPTEPSVGLGAEQMLF